MAEDENHGHDEDEHSFPLPEVVTAEGRNLSDLIDSMAMERNIYITAKKTNRPDDQRLPSTRFHLVFCFLHRACCSDHSDITDTQIFHTYREFHHPFCRFASVDETKSLVAAILSDQEFVPFSIDGERGQGLHWTETNHNLTNNLVEVLERGDLDGFDDVVTKVSKAAARVVGEAAALGRKVVEMVVTINKRTVLPHEEVERLRAQYLDEDSEYSSVMAQSFSESAEAFVSAPAAKSAVEALEKFRYERRGSDVEDEKESKLIMTCVICMEDVMIGSYLTCMPCSHTFHGVCISEWLAKNPTCPLCRFKLPSE